MQKDIFVSPYTAIRLFAKTYLSFGKTVLSDRRYKITREAWIASMYLVALASLKKRDWWLTPVVDDTGSPDFVCCSFVRGNKGTQTDRHLLKLEVFEWRDEDTISDLLTALKKHKLDKLVDPELTIICYIRRGIHLESAKSINEKLRKLAPKVKDIWYVACTASDSKTWQVAQVFPGLAAVTIDYDEVLRTQEKHSFIFAYRGKSRAIDFEFTGETVLLTPEFTFEIPT